MKSLNDLWRIPAYIPSIKPSLNTSLVSECEKEIGYKLPKSLIDLLTQQNGGYIRKALGSPYPGDMVWGIGEEWPSISKPNWATERSYVDFELDGLIPFDGDGHWHLCLDYRSGKEEPAVSFLDTECNEQKKVAASFDEFIGKLTIPNLKNTYVIHCNESISDFVELLEQQIGMSFTKQSSIMSNGYPFYKLRFESVWIWLSPNLVRRGFTREGMKYAGEYEYLLNEQGFRYPEVNEACVLLELSSDENANALDMLKKHHVLQKISDF